MKNRIKHLALSVILATSLMFGLVACGEKTPSDPSGAFPAEKLKIGVVMYSFNDDQGKTIQDYCSYLTENFNVEFAFEATNYNDDAHVSCVENLLASGCKAIISGYDTGLESAIGTCEDAGAYYILALDYAAPSDASNVTSKFFLGGTQQFGGDTAALGEAYAQSLIGSGVKTVSGVSFPPFAFVEAPEIYGAFADALRTDGKTVQELSFASGFMQPDVATAVATALANHAEAIFGLASGLDFVYPELKNNYPDVKLLALGYNDSVSSLLDEGTLMAAGNNNHIQSIASCFARILNAVEEKQYSDVANGDYNKAEGDMNIPNGVASYPVFYDKEGLDAYLTYMVGRGTNGMEDGPVTAEELKEMILSINADATLADLNKLTNRSIDEIKAIR
jgi:ABC-type sugar transport system substrate-binding protein